MKDTKEFEDVQVQSNWIKLNKPNDYVKGTLIAVHPRLTPDQYGKKNNTYSILIDEGSFHSGSQQDDGNYVVDAEPTTPEAGETWMIGHNTIFDNLMGQVEIGQRVFIFLEGFKKSETKGHKPAKIIKVKRGGINQEWLDGQGEAQF